VSIRAHAKAVVDQLQTDPILNGATFQGLVLNRPSRYCTVHMDSGRRIADRFTGPQSQQDYTITIHSAGTSTEQAQLVAERVYAALLGVVLTVPGRKCHRVRSIDSQPVELDRDVTPPLFYSTDVFELVSDPA
jgi:hypothetical protein